MLQCILWQERNQRIFSNRVRLENDVFKDIENFVVATAGLYLVCQEELLKLGHP